MENRGQSGDAVSDRTDDREIRRLKKKIVFFFAIALLLLEVAFCLLTFGATNTVTVVAALAILVLGATPALITTIVLNHRKNARSSFNRDNNPGRFSTQPRQ